jgi:hypothetical protein
MKLGRKAQKSLWDGSHKLPFFCGLQWFLEGKFFCVEKETNIPIGFLKDEILLSYSIAIISHDGIPCMSKMHTELMGSSGEWSEGDIGEIRSRVVEYFVMGDCGFAFVPDLR